MGNQKPKRRDFVTDAEYDDAVQHWEKYCKPVMSEVQGDPNAPHISPDKPELLKEG